MFLLTFCIKQFIAFGHSNVKMQLETQSCTQWIDLRLCHIYSSFVHMISSWIQPTVQKVYYKGQAVWMRGSGWNRNKFDGLGRFRWVLPSAHTVCRASVVSVRSLSSAHTVRIFFIECWLHVLAAWETLDTVLQKVATKKHVYPGVAATIQGSQ